MTPLNAMNTVTLSESFEVRIPQEVREALHLVPGDQLRIIRFEGHVELVPVRPMREYRGFLRGMDATIDREDASCLAAAHRRIRHA
jgi:AbrB family looped-hinge helix DNA binding protein